MVLFLLLEVLAVVGVKIEGEDEDEVVDDAGGAKLKLNVPAADDDAVVLLLDD